MTKGLTQHATLPVSAGLLRDMESYVAALTAYRDGDPVPIVEQFAEAALYAASAGAALVDDVAGVRARWRDGIAARRHSAVWSLLDLVVAQPVVTSRFALDQLVPVDDVDEHKVRVVRENAVSLKFEQSGFA